MQYLIYIFINLILFGGLLYYYHRITERAKLDALKNKEGDDLRKVELREIGRFILKVLHKSNNEINKGDLEKLQFYYFRLEKSYKTEAFEIGAFLLFKHLFKKNGSKRIKSLFVGSSSEQVINEKIGIKIYNDKRKSYVITVKSNHDALVRIANRFMGSL
jgi:hypothetical protein